MFNLLIPDKEFENLMYCKLSFLIRFATIHNQISLVDNESYSSNSLPDTVAK